MLGVHRDYLSPHLNPKSLLLRTLLLRVTTVILKCTKLYLPGWCHARFWARILPLRYLRWRLNERIVHMKTYFDFCRRRVEISEMMGGKWFVADRSGYLKLLILFKQHRTENIISTRITWNRSESSSLIKLVGEPLNHSQASRKSSADLLCKNKINLIGEKQIQQRIVYKIDGKSSGNVYFCKNCPCGPSLYVPDYYRLFHEELMKVWIKTNWKISSKSRQIPCCRLFRFDFLIFLFLFTDLLLLLLTTA